MSDVTHATELVLDINALPGWRRALLRLGLMLGWHRLINAAVPAIPPVIEVYTSYPIGTSAR